MGRVEPLSGEVRSGNNHPGKGVQGAAERGISLHHGGNKTTKAVSGTNWLRVEKVPVGCEERVEHLDIAGRLLGQMWRGLPDEGKKLRGANTVAKSWRSGGR